jgi:hypothetical protein
MNPVTLSHPQPEELAAFISGQAGDDVATAISQHLADCEACRTMVDTLPPDTLLSLLRKGAEPLGAETDPAADAKRGTSEAATIAPSTITTCADVPAELADNPRYRVLELLGSGGMGAVYKAEHRRMERHVALKVLSPGLMTKPAMVERFQREMRAAARLAHPNIVTAHDADQAGDAHFLVMEFVEGMSLAQYVHERSRLPVAEACGYIRQAALGLQHAFERGMVHRDIKPHNLMLTPAGQVKILDFGLARLVRETSAESCAQGAGGQAPSAGLTEVGTLMGTADFIAPEQANDPRAADIRADIYSLGCTLYFLLTGRVPFPEGTSMDKLMAHAKKTPVSLGKLHSEVPADLARVVEKMMAKDPARRYQIPAEAARALEPFIGKRSPLAAFVRRHRRLATAAGVLAAMVVTATIIYVQTDNGEFIIETEGNARQPLAIMINENGLKIHDLAGKREYLLNVGKHTLPRGDYQIDVSELPDGVEFTTTAFAIRRGGQEKVTVRFRRKGNRQYLADGLRWFPADATFIAARDMRILKELSLQQLTVLSEMVHAPRGADATFLKLVRDAGKIDRVTFAYADGKGSSGRPRMFARLTGSIHHERLADLLRHQWPGAREAKRAGKENITIIDSTQGVAPAFAFIGETDILVATDLSKDGKHLEVLKQALELRSGKGTGLAGGLVPAGDKIPADAWAFFAGRPPEVFKNLFLFPALPRSILVTIHGTAPTRFHFEGQFASAADAAAFVKNATFLKGLGLGFVKSSLFSHFPKASGLLTKALNGLDVKSTGDRVSGGYDIPAGAMEAITEVVQKAPLSDVKKLLGGSPPEADGADAGLIKKFAPDDKLIGHERVTFTPEYGGWRIEPEQPCTIPLYEIANPSAEDCVVTYRARLKTHKVQGRAYLEMHCRLPGKGEFFSRGLFNPVSGTTDWIDREIPFYLEKGQRPDLIKLNLVIEGTPEAPLGRVWIKEVEVCRAPLPAMDLFAKDLGKRIKAFRPTDKTVTADRVVRDGDGWRIDSREKEFRTVHLFEVPNPGVDNCLLLYRLQMKTKLLGTAYQEMWCRFPKAADDAPIEGDFFSKGFNRVVSGNTDWTTYVIHFHLEKNQRPDPVRLDLVVGGMGQVWIKNVELVQVPLAP